MKTFFEVKRHIEIVATNKFGLANMCNPHHTVYMLVYVIEIKVPSVIEIN